MISYYSSLKLWILPINSIEVILRSSHWRRSAKIFEYVFFKTANQQSIHGCICVQNLWIIPVKEFNFSKVAELKRATVMKNWTPFQNFLIGFSTVAEPFSCRAPPSGCLCALLERKRTKEMKYCVSIALSLPFFYVALQGSVGERRTN